MNSTIPAMQTEEDILKTKHTHTLDAKMQIKDYNSHINDNYLLNLTPPSNLIIK